MSLLTVLALVGMSGDALAQAYPTDPGDLTVTEFMSEPQQVPNYYGEWFEVYNGSGRNMDIQGVVVYGGDSGESITVADSVTLAAGDYYIFLVEADPALNGGLDPEPTDSWDGFGYTEYSRWDFDLDETGDSIELWYGSVLLDELVWAVDDLSDWSMTKDYAQQVNLNALSLEWANDLAHNWCDADDLIRDRDGTAYGLYGTPGADNQYCSDSNTDGDGDGFSEVEGDCDDEDAYVNPDAIDGDEATGYGATDDDGDCNGARDDGLTDDDGDGYAEVDGDCDDDAVNVNPGASETLDDVDNDCNGCVDDKDDDADGFTECVDEDGLYDCDDADNSVYPGATEIPYNVTDEDCDGFDLCDQDGDGYTSDECPEESVLPARSSEEDCDDTDAEVHPNASEGDPETGGVADGKDNDCDGIVDDPYLDADGDGWALSDGDCLDDPDNPQAAAVYPGAEELCDDVLDNDCDGLYNEECGDAQVYAVVRGGGLCSALPGGRSAPAGAIALFLLTMVAAGTRRRPCGV